MPHHHRLSRFLWTWASLAVAVSMAPESCLAVGLPAIDLVRSAASRLKARAGGVFADIPDRSANYPILPQPAEFKAVKPSGVSRGYWLDNDRILVGVTDPVRSELTQLEWNTRSGTVTRRGGGRVVCCSLDSYVILDPNNLETRRTQNLPPYLYGPIGGPYETAPVNTLPGESSSSPFFYNPFSCRIYPNPGARKYRVPSIITPLVEGDGWLIDADDGKHDSLSFRELIAVRADGTEAFRKKFPKGERGFTISGHRPGMAYLPWLKKYWIPSSPKSDKVPYETYLFDPRTESLETLTWPDRYRSIAVGLYPVRNGLLSFYVPVPRGPRDAARLMVGGLYLLKRDGSVIKVHQWETDYHMRMRQSDMTLTISPNGCRVFVYAGVFDLCRGGE